MRISYKMALAMVIMFGVIRPVLANGGSSTNSISLGMFSLIILAVSLIIAVFLYWLYTNQSQPGVLPMRKLITAAVATVVINALVLGFLYVEV